MKMNYPHINEHETESNFNVSEILEALPINVANRAFQPYSVHQTKTNQVWERMSAFRKD